MCFLPNSLNVWFQIIYFKTYRKWPRNQMFDSQYKIFSRCECFSLFLMSDKTFNIGGTLATIYCWTSVTIPNIEKMKIFCSPVIGFWSFLFTKIICLRKNYFTQRFANVRSGSPFFTLRVVCCSLADSRYLKATFNFLPSTSPIFSKVLIVGLHLRGFSNFW